jgi:hypothetical protein
VREKDLPRYVKLEQTKWLVDRIREIGFGTWRRCAQLMK